MSKSISNFCECADDYQIETTLLDKYKANIHGMDIVLIKSVHQETCDKCGEQSVVIPDLNGLVAAAALARVKINLKLTGNDIRFIRKALGFSSKQFAEILGVTTETMSRWGNDKVPMGPSNEKLVRLMAGALLEDDAPAIDFNSKEIIEMKLVSVMESGKSLRMEFTRGKYKKNKKPEDFYMETNAA